MKKPWDRGWGTPDPLYKLYRYVPPQRVKLWFLPFWSEIGYVFKRTTRASVFIGLFIFTRKREKDKWKWVWLLTYFGLKLGKDLDSRVVPPSPPKNNILWGVPTWALRGVGIWKQKTTIEMNVCGAWGRGIPCMYLNILSIFQTGCSLGLQLVGCFLL